MRRLLTLFALVAVTGAALVACGRAAGGPQTLTIGAVYPTTGAQGAGGSDELRGARLAVTWANEHGGVRGRDVRLQVEDADRAEAVPHAMDALEGDGVRVVLGTHGSTISAVAATEATRRHMVLWETGAVGDVPQAVAGGRNFFRLVPMGEELGRAAIDFVHDELTPKLGINRPLRYAVAHVEDAYGRAVGAGAAADIERRGLTLAADIGYEPSADPAATARRLAAARPDVLFVAAYLEDGVDLRRATVAQGLHLVASIGTSSSYCMPEFGQTLGQDAVGLFASDKPDGPVVRADALRPEGRRTLEWARARYRATYHEDMTSYALSGFANTYALLAHVLPTTTSDSAKAVAAAAVKVKLPAGTLANGSGVDLVPPDRPDAGANRAASSVIWEWVAPGERAVVWPPAFATHPVVALPIS